MRYLTCVCIVQHNTTPPWLRGQGWGEGGAALSLQQQLLHVLHDDIDSILAPLADLAFRGA